MLEDPGRFIERRHIAQVDVDAADLAAVEGAKLDDRYFRQGLLDLRDQSVPVLDRPLFCGYAVEQQVAQVASVVDGDVAPSRQLVFRDDVVAGSIGAKIWNGPATDIEVAIVADDIGKTHFLICTAAREHAVELRVAVEDKLMGFGTLVGGGDRIHQIGVVFEEFPIIDDVVPDQVAAFDDNVVIVANLRQIVDVDDVLDEGRLRKNEFRFVDLFEMREKVDMHRAESPVEFLHEHSMADEISERTGSVHG